MYTDAATIVHRPMPRPAPFVEEPTQVIAVPRRPRTVARRRGRLRLTVAILVATGVIVGAVLGGFWFVQQRDSVPTAAAVGSCVSRTGDDGVAATGCGDPGAQFTVVGRVEGRTQAQASASCAGVRGATLTYWKGATGGVGTVLCLEPRS